MHALCCSRQVPRWIDSDVVRRGSERESGQRPNGGSARPPRGARRSSACRNCSARSISAARRMRELFALAEPIPGPSTEALGSLARELRVVIDRVAVRAARGGPVSQHGGGHRHRRRNRGAVSQDAHPRRSAVLREVLLHARRSRVSEFRHAVRPHRRAGVLGPVVSGRRAPLRAAAARTFCSIPRPSAGIPRRRRSTARRSSTPGGPSSARTPSPTASTWRR